MIKFGLPKTEHGQHSYFCKQALSSIASSLIPLCGGMAFGITAVMLPQLREDSSIEYDPGYDSWIASISSIPTIIGSLSCGTLLDAYGRKAAHIIAAVPFVLGWVCIAFANSTGLILTGRFITGISSCAMRIVTIVYVGEITDPKIRPAALFLPSMLGHVGILFSHIVGYYLTWRISAAICIIPALISLTASLFLKESPLWLIAKGRRDEGIDNFRWFRGTGEASEMELKTVFERQAEKPKISLKSTLKIACKMSFIKPILVSMVLVLNIQFTGVAVISVYSQDIFKRSFSGKVDAFLLMIAIDCVRGIISLICCVLGKFLPRKKAFLASNFGVSVFIFGLVMSLCFLKSGNFIWVQVTCLVMYISFASVLVTIGWTFVPELLPNSARGFGSGINATFSYLTLFIIVKMTPDIMDTLGEPVMFAVYGISSFICGVVLAFILPETNGKTLQSIEDIYDSKKVDPTIQA